MQKNRVTCLSTLIRENLITLRYYNFSEHGVLVSKERGDELWNSQICDDSWYRWEVAYNQHYDAASVLLGYVYSEIQNYE